LSVEMGAFRTLPRVQSQNRLVRAALIAAGSVLVGIGILGIFLPLLPTTVFFLMAAGCYGKSSPGAYRWLTTNRWFGRYLRDYREEHGATVGAKLFSLGSLWLGIGISAYFVRGNIWVAGILLVVALGVTVHLLTLSTIRRNAA
jgi:uncharacterized membrane protein YbaN (DUF454 family)